VVARAFSAFSAEFPNDNSALHFGTIWMCVDVCGRAEAHLHEAALPAEMEALPPEVEDEGAEEAAEPIEIVESIELEGPIEIVPAPLESSVVASLPDREDDLSVETTQCATELETKIEAENVTRLVSTPPPPIKDPFEAFLQTLSDVACDSGQTFAASEIAAALAGDAVALAWRAILNGEGEDFSLCGTPLDEWASGVLAKILSAPHKAAQLRRELRARGVAAFGLVEAA
jgi:hypothetical protein